MTKTEIQTSREAANILSATLSRTPDNDLDCKMLAKTEDIKSIIVSSVLDSFNIEDFERKPEYYLAANEHSDRRKSDVIYVPAKANSAPSILVEFQQIIDPEFLTRTANNRKLDTKALRH
ncbi:hypothetical protein A0J61_03784 [Choanephora cucurbitarum]|uniref:Uncharacterized protein n=1 Tax=Choanephora cucurbitarum TaxID=101091 RepID=A0A1C7NGS7_9FUNG|nr:hypothetical protein A0J61_03784 [Choanephora cucurbitarum]